jgi:hypothetical protein
MAAKKKAKKKAKRKSNYLLDVGLWWCFKPSLLSGDKVTFWLPNTQSPSSVSFEGLCVSAASRFTLSH